jgi:hypothetical protein
MEAGVPFEDLSPGVPGLSIRGPMIFAFLAVMGTAVMLFRRRQAIV